VPEHEGPVNYLRCQPFRELAYSLLASRSGTLFAGFDKRVLLTEAPFVDRALGDNDDQERHLLLEM
jgi:hypothetical protein